MVLPRLYFLGRSHIELNQQAVPEIADKGVALLAYLALTGSPQLRERLLGLLWADSAEEAARKNLRNVLWGIRRSLGSELLVSQDERLTLAEGVWVDVREFEQLVAASPQAAVALYQGPLLDGLALSGAPELELWFTGERERLAQLHLRALATLVNQYRGQGQWREMAAVARRALAHDNLQEPMHRAIMEAHARLGERAEALRQYDALQAILAQELGVEPLAETVALREAILGSERWPAAPSPAPRPQPAAG
ncbi:MAG: BTAD domain-containing putative transcriptional regulator, partial [Chloroflexota bacterium]